MGSGGEEDSKPIMVGQAPSRTSDPDRPLVGRSGKILAKHVGIERHGLYLKFLCDFERRNVLDYYPGSNGDGKGDRFPMDEARGEARDMVDDFRGRFVLALGSKTYRALTAGTGADGKGYFETTYINFHEEPPNNGFHVTPVPHPSGLNRWWNDESNRERYRDFMVDVIEEHCSEFLERVVKGEVDR